MEISADVRMILNRCRAMNCLYEGQSFSWKSFADACGAPGRSESAVEEMVETGLIVRKIAGAYSLTAVGAETLKTAALAHKRQVFPKRQFQERPPINKL